MCLPEYFMVGHSTIDNLFFTDDHAILSDSENRLQMGIHLLNRICKDSGLQMSTRRTKVLAFRGTDPVQAKIVIDGIVPVSYTHLDVYKRQGVY